MSGFATINKKNVSLDSGWAVVNGVWRKLGEGFVVKNGVWKSCYSGGISFLDIPSGTLIAIKHDGAAKNFIVVHHGLPSDIYDASCNGTWLLSQTIYKNMVWNSDYNHNYAESNIHPELNNNYFSKFDSKVQAKIKEVKIPYFNGAASNGSVMSGASGLPARVFIPSSNELVVDPTIASFTPVKEGSCLEYFLDVPDRYAHPKRVATLDGTAAIWYTRTPNLQSGRYVVAVTANGGLNSNYFTDNRQGIRPMFILPSDLTVEPTPNADGSYTLIV